MMASFNSSFYDEPLLMLLCHFFKLKFSLHTWEMKISKSNSRSFDEKCLLLRIALTFSHFTLPDFRSSLYAPVDNWSKKVCRVFQLGVVCGKKQ